MAMLLISRAEEPEYYNAFFFMVELVLGKTLYACIGAKCLLLIGMQK